MIRSLVIFLLWPFLLHPVVGQNGTSDVVVRFENLTVQDRLPSHRVLCLCQDQRGFMWFGTEEGLCRYDGYSFVEFFADINDPYSLRNNAIRSIVEDQFGNLWIGTDGGGLHYFDQETWKFYSYPLPYKPIDHPRSIPGIIYAILRTSDENYWIGSYGQGLYALPKYNKPSEIIDYCESGKSIGITHILPTEEPGGLNDPNVFCLYEDKAKTIWVGTDDYGSDKGGALHELILKKGKADKYYFKKYRSDSTDNASLGSNYIMSVYEDSRGRFWVCNWEGGLNLLDRVSGKVIQYRGKDLGGILNCDDVYSLTEDSSGNLWVATYGGGISRMVESDNGSLKFLPYLHEAENPNSLIGDFVRQIFRSQSGLLWAITWKSGISRIRVTHNPFLHIPLPNHSYSDTITEVIRDMRISSSGKLTLYTEEQGFMELDLNQHSGLSKFSKIADPRQWPSEQIYQTRLGKEFVGNAAFESQVSNVRVYYEDSHDKLWLGKESSLLRISVTDFSKIKVDTFSRNSQNPTSLKGFHVTGIAEDQSGRIWVSTFDALNYYDEVNNSFRCFTMKNGLPGNAISGMLIDNNNFIWLATENGLARFDPLSHISQNYNISDGLPFIEFATRVGYGMEDFQNFPAFHELPDGRFVFSTIRHGMLVFDPNDVYRDLSPPRLWITEFRILNEIMDPDKIYEGMNDSGHEISIAKSIVLGSRDKSFSFSISVLDYFAPKNTRFAYRLRPIDESWHYMGTESRLLTFSLLSPGEYLFEVKGANSDGIWNDVPTSIVLHIPTPWWNMNWFRLTAGVLIISFIVVIVVRAKQRNQILHSLNLEKLRREEQDKFTQMRMRFYTNVTHEFRTPLTLILGPLGKLERLVEKDPDAISDLSIMKRNGLRLLNLVNQLMDFRKIETKAMQLQVEEGNISAYIRGICDLFGENILSKEINFRLLSEPQNITGYFDRSAIDKIVFNLLSNAFKYTKKQGRISVTINAFISGTIDWVRISIRDSGAGIPEKVQEKIFTRFYQVNTGSIGSGIGLSIVQSLTWMHKGKVEVRSKPGEGSNFIIEIPVHRSVYLEKEISDRAFHSGIDFSTFRPAIIRQQGENPKNILQNKKCKLEVLVVDDNPDMLCFIEGILREDFNLRKASTAECALKIIDTNEPDIIITDIMMPGIGGFELVKLLKNDSKFSHIPIIIVSALEGKTNEIKGLKLGAEDFLRKPFDPDILLAKINNHIKLRQQFRNGFIEKRYDQVEHSQIGIPDQVFLNDLMNKIDGHYINPGFSVKELVEHMGMSHSVLFRKVKALTGQNLTELIVMIRLEKAHEILLAERLPVKEVAYRVGFSDPKYFSTRFKKKYNISPSAIKQ